MLRSTLERKFECNGIILNRSEILLFKSVTVNKIFRHITYYYYYVRQSLRRLNLSFEILNSTNLVPFFTPILLKISSSPSIRKSLLISYP